MAINETPQSIEKLDASKARLAGLLASVVSLAASAAMAVWVIRLMGGGEEQSDLAMRLMPLLVFAVVGLIAGAALALGKSVSAQQFTLGYWLVVIVAAVAAALGASLWKMSPELAETFRLAPESANKYALLAALGAVILGCVVVAMLTSASKPGSRQRYASMVIVSVSFAVAAMIAVNMLAGKKPVHSTWETLGHYGMSERTKKILKDVTTPVRLTCVYTSDEPGKKAEDYRPRVMELLEDMKLYSDKVTVDNVTTDAGKVELLGRLRDQLGTQADTHKEFVEGFDKEAQSLQAALESQAKWWKAHSGQSYLNQWGLAVEISSALDGAIKKLKDTRQKVSAAMAGAGLPDYANLVTQIKESEQAAKNVLEQSGKLVESVGKIAEAATNPETKKSVLSEVQAFRDAMAATVAAVASGGDDPNDPAAVLNRYVFAANAAAKQANDLAAAMDNIAGPDLAELLQQNSHLSLPMGPVSIPLSTYLQQVLGTQLKKLADQTAAIAKNTKADYQKKFIAQARQDGKTLTTSAEQVAKLLEKAVLQLGQVDEQSAQAFKAAKDGKLFTDILTRIDATLAEAGKLPELKDTSISTDIAGDNIVIIEARGKAEVISFDEIWPLKVPSMGMAPPEPDSKKRQFFGDATISSRVLKMTSDPFAVVLFAYFGAGPDTPPQMARMMPQPDLPVMAFNTLRKRLEAANFAVEDWNLSQPMPDPNDHKGLQKVLIVLPPAPTMPQNPMQRMPMPQFGPEQEKRITDAIADGTPAVFLTTFSPPRQVAMFMPPASPPYAWGRYLRETWGLEVQTDYLVVPAVADGQTPGRYKVDAIRFNYLPLSSFSDQPVGKPLQGQRVMWTNLCPITRKRNARGESADPPAGVNLQPVLTFPASDEATWATQRIQELVTQFRTTEGSYISPNYEAGDQRVPFALAVAATRAGNEDKNIKPSRILVMSVGASLTDGYLDREVQVHDAKGTISLADPPRANADLAINSVYWLIGRQGLIASGPVQATMREIPPTLKNVLIVIYCVLLPLLVLAVGGLVLYQRKR